MKHKTAGANSLKGIFQMRIMDNIAIKPPSTCWQWTRSLNKWGYGTIKLKAGGRDRYLRAHRVSYEAFVGDIPEGYIIRHLCNNPGCVNPDHLAVGLPKENTRDMIEACRHLDSEGVHKSSKLNREQILAIYKDERTSPVVAAEYGVTRQAVHSIRTGRSHKAVTGG